MMPDKGGTGGGVANEIMTVEEVAAYLRLQPQTIYKWAQEKRIPAAKLGKEWRFRKSILDRWLDQQILGPDSGFAHLRPAVELPAAGPEA